MNHPSKGTVYKINLVSFVAISNSKYSREINALEVIFCQMSPGTVTHHLRHSTYVWKKYTALENVIVTKISNAF